jgi:hypothetical protein
MLRSLSSMASSLPAGTDANSGRQPDRPVDVVSAIARTTLTVDVSERGTRQISRCQSTQASTGRKPIRSLIEIMCLFTAAFQVSM